MVDKTRIENAVREILIAIGEDPNREGLLETPKRVANMYEEVFAGMHQDPKELIKVFYEGTGDDLVVVKDITLYSMCEHHLLPFTGQAHVIYLPNESGEILGLSKVARLVDNISKKPQLQEKLCAELADIIVEAINPRGVCVVVEAEHLCMTMRGIRKPGSKTVTFANRGIFKNDAQKRAEALSLINISGK